MWLIKYAGIFSLVVFLNAQAQSDGNTSTTRIPGTNAAPPENIALVPSCILNSSPEAAVAGQTVTLNWLTTNASEVRFDGTGNLLPASGSTQVTVSPPHEFRLNVNGPGGTGHCTLRINEQAMKPSCKLTFKSDRFGWGYLSWQTAFATEARFDGTGNLIAVSGSVRVLASSLPHEFRLNINGPGGSASCSYNVREEDFSLPSRRGFYCYSNADCSGLWCDRRIGEPRGVCW